MDLTFTGFHGILDYIEIVADESSIMGQLDWMIVDNNTDSQLLIASVGTQGISQSGKLFSIRMGVGDELESQLYPSMSFIFKGMRILRNIILNWADYKLFGVQSLDLLQKILLVPIL